MKSNKAKMEGKINGHPWKSKCSLLKIYNGDMVSTDVLWWIVLWFRCQTVPCADWFIGHSGAWLPGYNSPRSAAWSRLGGRRATFGGRHILAEYVTALQSVMTKVRTKVNCISHPVGRWPPQSSNCRKQRPIWRSKLHCCHRGAQILQPNKDKHKKLTASH